MASLWSVYGGPTNSALIFLKQHNSSPQASIEEVEKWNVDGKFFNSTENLDCKTSDQIVYKD